MASSPTPNPFNVESATETVASAPVVAGITATSTAKAASSPSTPSATATAESLAKVSPQEEENDAHSPKVEDAKLAEKFDAIQAAYKAGKPRRDTIRARVVE